MTPAAIMLLIVSAFIHATWNLIGKREEPSPRFFLAANMVGVVCLSPVALAHLNLPGRFPAEVWLLVAITGLFQAVYFTGLAGAYRAGHLSVAYPLARSAPVVIVAAVTALMGKAHQLTPCSVVGMVLVAIGGLLLPIGRFTDWKLRDYFHASTLFALMAAVGTSGYSIVDDSALRVLRETVSMGAGRAALTLTYAFFEGISTSLWLGAFVLLGRRSAIDSAKPMRHRAASAALAGLGICLAYVIVLLAMTFAKNVSYVVAFRQLSIPIGAVLGVTVLREPRNTAKLAGVAIMLVGLVLVALC